MSKGEYLGEFEIVILSTLQRLGDAAYGVTIRCAIDERTGRSVSIGAIYATLRRLERKGLVNSRLGEPTAERGGRAKRFFALEAAGVEAVERSRAMFARLWEDLPEPPA
ncbi:MAG: PadR family transcriptional regulator [Acidobacteria bacterium]|nr:PadR family transcriptional regulator [Acidobacteriota bacterium]